MRSAAVGMENRKPYALVRLIGDESYWSESDETLLVLAISCSLPKVISESRIQTPTAASTLIGMTEGQQDPLCTAPKLHLLRNLVAY